MELVEEYLTLREAGDVLQVSLATIRRWVRSGDLVAIKLGTAKQSPVRIRRSDLDAFAARHRATISEPSSFGYKRPPAIEGVA